MTARFGAPTAKCFFLRPNVQARNKMTLGYTDPSTGQFKVASSVQLRNIVRVNSDEATRKAAFEVSWAELQKTFGSGVNKQPCTRSDLITASFKAIVCRCCISNQSRMLTFQY